MIESKRPELISKRTDPGGARYKKYMYPAYNPELIYKQSQLLSLTLLDSSYQKPQEVAALCGIISCLPHTKQEIVGPHLLPIILEMDSDRLR